MVATTGTKDWKHNIVLTIEWIMVATTGTKDWKHNIVCCADHRVDYGGND